MKREKNLSSSKDALSKRVLTPKGILLTAFFFTAFLFSGCNSTVSENLPGGTTETGSKTSSSGFSVKTSEDIVKISPSAASRLEDSVVSPSKPQSPASLKKDDNPAAPDCTESGKQPEPSSEAEAYASPEDTEKFLQDVLEQLDSYEDSLR